MVLLAVAPIGACTGSIARVSVDKKPLVVETKYLEEAKEKSPVEPHEQAATDWHFGCKTEFDFEIIDESKLGNEFLISVKVKKVKVSLEAPVVIWISRNAENEVKEHEEAHVKICRRVYQNAEDVAKAACEKVFGREYQGSGATADEAAQKALSVANQEICQYYHNNLVENVNRVSEIFDSLDPLHEKPVDEIVDMSFREYSKVRGTEAMPKEQVIERQGKGRL